MGSFAMLLEAEVLIEKNGSGVSPILLVNAYHFSFVNC